MRIVPSIGLSTASYDATLAALSAAATFVALPGVAVRNVVTSPRKIWLKITPLLPRAPISDPWLMASHVGSSAWSAFSSSVTTASRVRDMFVPVSPSGTGYTLSKLIPAAWRFMVSRKVITVSRRASAPKISRTGIDKSYRFAAQKPETTSHSPTGTAESRPLMTFITSSNTSPRD